MKQKKERFRILSRILFFLPRVRCFFPSTKISFWVYCIFQDKIQSLCVFVRYCFVENSAPIFFVNTKCKKKKERFRILSRILFFLPRVRCFFPSTKISFWVYCIFQDKIQSLCVFVRYCFVENSAPIFFVNTKCKKKKERLRPGSIARSGEEGT